MGELLRRESKIDCVNATVPLWAFVALGLAAPVVALISVLVSTQAESRRTQRAWLRQTKYESYERLFTAYFAMTAAYSDFLDAPIVTAKAIKRLSGAHENFKHQYDKTKLIASLRVSFSMDIEMLRTWFDIMFQLNAATEGEPAPKPHRGWGGYGDTSRAAAWDLGVRRDPGGWLAKWRDRGDVVPSNYVRRAAAEAKAEESPTVRFEVSNPYETAEPEEDEPEAAK
jgi:hypothetical protein